MKKADPNYPNFAIAVVKLYDAGFTRSNITKAFSMGKTRPERATVYRYVSQVLLSSGIRAHNFANRTVTSRNPEGQAILPWDLQ